MPEAPNAVRELAEDPTSRKKFLRMAGGTGVAASFAAFVAACGGDDKSATGSKARGGHADGEHVRHRAVRQGRSRHRELRADARVPRGPVLQRRRRERHAQGQDPRAGQELRRQRAGARRRAHRHGQEGGRQAGRQADGEVPARQREVDPRRSPPPSRTSAPTHTSARPGTSRTRRSWLRPCRSTPSRPATPPSSTSPRRPLCPPARSPSRRPPTRCSRASSPSWSPSPAKRNLRTQWTTSRSTA